MAKVAAGTIPFGAPLDEVMSNENPNVVSGGNPRFKSFEDIEDRAEIEKQGAKDVTHAGLALMAKDSGRVLTLQRSNDDEKDPARGKLEFPGGGLEEGESPLEGAIREWKEETGSQLPPGQVTHDWLSKGMYQGFVYVVPSEDVLQINGSPGDRQVLNPDDPDQDHIETVIWMHPRDLKDHPATRREVRQGTDWSVFGKARRKAAAVACECGHNQSEHSRGRGTCESCWRHFMDHFQDYYQGTGPEVSYCKRYKGDRAKEAAITEPYGNTLYRGLHFGQGTPEDIEHLHRDPEGYLAEQGRYHTQGAGIHWTPDYDVAHRFAMGRDADDTYGDEGPFDDEEERGQNHGVVMEAQVHPRHQLDPESQEYEDYAMSDSILGPDTHERETTVRGGGKVHVHKLHAVSEGDPYDRVTSRRVRMHRRAMSDRSDYGMQHSPNEDGPPVHDLVGEHSYAPEDLYTHMHYYRTGDDQSDYESEGAIRKAKWDNVKRRRATTDFPEETEENFANRLDKRKAGEHHVTIYRAAPKGATLNTGDWVSLSRSYAKGESRHPTDKDQDMPVYEAHVPAKHVRWPGDSINEFGYFGPETKMTVRLRGGRNAPRVEPRPREGAMKVRLANGPKEGEKPSEFFQRLMDEAEAKAAETALPGTGRQPDDVSYQGGGRVPWENKHNIRNPDLTKPMHLEGEIPPQRMNSLHTAKDEIIVPRNIDTLRDSTCAVCGSVDSMNGDRCTVCGYMSTPQAFQSPDTSLAPKVRDQLGIGNPEDDALGGAPDAGLEGPEGAEDDLEGMVTDPEGIGAEDGEEGAPGGADLICDNCGSEFNSQEEEEDLSEPYLSPAARIEPDVSALGVEDDMEVARDTAMEENEVGTNEGVGYQEGDECPVCGVGQLVPFEGTPDMEGEEEGGPADFGGEAEEAEGEPPEGEVPEGIDQAQEEEGAPEDEDEGEEVEGGEDIPLDEEGAPVEDQRPEEEGPPGEQEGPDDQEEAPPDEEDEDQDVDHDEDDEEDEDGPPPPRQRKESSTMATTQRRAAPAARQAPRRTAAAPNPAAQERRRLFAALEAQNVAINRQADRLQAQDKMLAAMGRFVRQATTKMTELTVRNETLERQMALVANASGLMEPLATIGAAGQARVGALYGKQANPTNPAQPVPEPGSEPPAQTSQEAMESMGRDDVTQLGATPVANVAADAVTSVDIPYGELANQPVGMNRTDVTAPVQGTETATPPEMTVIPVDARIGNPDDPQPAFPFTIGPVGAPSRPFSGPSVGNPPTTAAQRPQEPGVAVHPQAQAHYIAAVNLARLRAQVGITNEEPFQLGGKIASSMNDAQINAEAQGLQAVASRQAAQPQPQYFQPGPAYPATPATSVPDARPMVPHMASTNGNGSVLPADPSFQAGKYGPGPGSAIQGTTMFAPREDEFGWDSQV